MITLSFEKRLVFIGLVAAGLPSIVHVSEVGKLVHVTRTIKSLKNLIDLYKAWNKPEKAKE